MSDEITGKKELASSDAARGASARTALTREPRWELNAKALQTRQLILDQARTLNIFKLALLERRVSSARNV